MLYLCTYISIQTQSSLVHSRWLVRFKLVPRKRLVLFYSHTRLYAHKVPRIQTKLIPVPECVETIAK